MCIHCPRSFITSLKKNTYLCSYCGVFGDSSNSQMCESDYCDRIYHHYCACDINWRICFGKRFRCPSHFCRVCKTEKNLLSCYRCTKSFCPKHGKRKIFKTSDDRYACSLHYSTFQKFEPYEESLENTAACVLAVEFWKLLLVPGRYNPYGLEYKTWNWWSASVEMIFLRILHYLPLQQKKSVYRAIHFTGYELWRIIDDIIYTPLSLSKYWYSRIIGDLLVSSRTYSIYSPNPNHECI